MFQIIALFVAFVIALAYVNKYSFTVFKVVTTVIFVKLVFLVAGISVTYINVFIEGILLLLVLHLWLVSLSTRHTFSAPGLWIFILYTVSLLVSWYLQGFDGAMKAFSFYRHLLVAYLFFLFAYNYPFQESQLKSFFKLFHFLIVIQILGAVIKFGTIGLAEKYVGLMEERAGSLNTIFPLVGISFFATQHYFYKKVKSFWWIILGMLFLGVVGIKRGFVVFLPILVVLGIYFYYKYVRRKSFVLLRGIVFSPVIAILMFVLVYFAVVFNPLMNKEGKIGGSFDLNYALETSVKHNVGGERDRGGHAVGRISSLIEILRFRFDNIDENDLFGDGVGMFVNVDNESSNIKDYNILTFTVLSSLCRQLISVGIVGSLSIFLFYIYFFVRIFIILRKRRDKFGIFLSVFVVLTGIVFFYDHIVYSPVFFNTHVPNFIFFIFSGLLMNKKLGMNNVQFQSQTLRIGKQ